MSKLLTGRGAKTRFKSAQLCILFKLISCQWVLELLPLCYSWVLDSLPLCCQWLLRLWGCVRAREITPGAAPRDSRPGHPAPLRPRPAITAATALPSREGAPQYLNRAFSAPRICTVDAGYLAKLVRLPACEMRRAPTCKQGAR